jgi:hypothetical protein
MVLQQKWLDAARTARSAVVAAGLGTALLTSSTQIKSICRGC